MKNYPVLKQFNNGNGGLAVGDTIPLDDSRARVLKARRMVGAAITAEAVKPVETAVIPEKTVEKAVKTESSTEKRTKNKKKKKR